ncbi:MAG: hypothetical protein AAB552_04060 [Patescibacteria group bacterium]
MKFLKGVAVFVVCAIVLGLLNIWFRTFVVGAYYVHAPLYLSAIVGASPILLIYIAYHLVQLVVKFDSSSFSN